jgi:hypothetical protein
MRSTSIAAAGLLLSAACGQDVPPHPSTASSPGDPVIMPDMLADIPVIDRDLRAIPAPEIRTAKILRTIVGGRTVFLSGP